MQEIEDLGAAICGVSVDRTGRLAQFTAKYRLPFVLLSDRDGAVARRYGSLVDLGLLKFARRNTFLVDPQGRVAKVYLSASAPENAKQVVDDLQSLTRK